MTLPTDPIAAYGAAWLETDEQSRLALLETAWGRTRSTATRSTGSPAARRSRRTSRPRRRSSPGAVSR
jgi:hypothetical protein